MKLPALPSRRNRVARHGVAPQSGDGTMLALVPGGHTTRRRSARAALADDGVKLTIAFFVTVGSLSLAGWATFGPGLLPGAGTAAAFAAAETVPDVANARGNIGKVVGQMGVLKTPDGAPQVLAVLTSIEPNFLCPAEGAPAPASGQYLALTMRISTTSDYGQDVTGFMPFPVTAEKFLLLSPDGVVDDGAGTDQVGCLGEAGKVPTAMGSDGTAYVQVVFDTDQTTGSVVFTPGAWEWAF